ncbi:hypothetical protein FA95DRAFT_1584227 [Auriscalpium vulgare]|uniref:Uncharacterized protein n=1 Tax=Auriscalpium vulgare TaxID=40419 RepID=A0ACB8RGA7_9AGAM|nr:hypothetical protein FA95DRAFT_1584227 [Auriscalpium vulgare]
MSARRQPSTTSLSKYARAGSPDPAARSLDYCNAFWGLADGGVDVLFARMRGAGRTMDELRNFWKERASIEEDYAKRLTKLAKLAVGRDEIGEFRNAIETLRQETEKQGNFHLQLAHQIRNDLEAPATVFVQRQAQHRKVFQSAIEKQFKTKQAQEVHVSKAREKYEADCLRINGYTAESMLRQGKELERLTLKLERTQQTVQANERDFANFTRVLQDTTAKWETDWKAFCDTCQDLEEERMEFTKDNVWAYANAVSIVCVSDDESCEHIRVALEQFEPERDQENFVRDYGTGSLIPDAPQFVSYSGPEGKPLPSSSSQPTTRPAHFARSSQRVSRLPPAQQPPQDEEPMVNTAGVGAGGNRGTPNDVPPPRNRPQSRASHRGMNGQVAANGVPPPSTSPPTSGSRPGTGHGQQRMVDPTTHKTMLVVGDNTYEVDAAKDPRGQPSSGAANSRVGDETDPMVKAMTDLRNASASSVGRSATRKNTIGQGSTPAPAAGGSSASPSNALTPPSTSPANRDYRNSAELVVGTYPLQQSSSRPSSPQPPTAAFMKAPTQPPAPVVDSVIRTYQHSFPGEVEQRRSRSNSRRESYNGPPAQQQAGPATQGNNLDRPVSRDGHAGVGANGRSRSPSLNVPSRGVSPAGGQSSAGYGYRDNGQRAASPNPVGIALDPNGNVAMDSMADVYHQQQQKIRQPQQQPPPMQPPPPAPYQQPPPQMQPLQAPPAGRQQQQIQQQIQRNPSMSNPAYGAQQQQPPPAQWATQNAAYAAQTPQGYGQAAPGGHSPAYSSPGHPYANAPPSQVFQPPPAGYGAPPANGAQRAGTVHRSQQSADYYGHQGYPSQSPQQQQQQQLGYGGGYRSVSPGPVGRSPSPSPQPMALSQPQPPPGQVVPPTRQYTEDGRGVLFYVKALYDYAATIPEEFDFQSGDIIAVTATPEDGWWSGELLDEARRVPGRHIFPSNFVHLF